MSDEQNDQRLTPKDFADHVLVIIAELTDYDTVASVHMSKTYEPVCERMGIPEDFGGETSHGSLFTHRTIGLAMRSLRDKGLTKYAKKGYWACTPLGIEEAGKATGHAVVTTDKTPEPELPVVSAARADATEETSDGKNSNVVHLPVTTPTHPYSDDPYIRSLAIEAVSCFGAYAKRSEACSECPIATDCTEFAEVRKAQIAAEIQAEEAKEAELAQKREIEKSKKKRSTAELIQSFGNQGAEVSDESVGKKGRYKVESGHTVAPARSQRETVCPQCSEKIAKKQQVMWVSQVGLFHPECVDTSDAKVGTQPR